MGSLFHAESQRNFLRWLSAWNVYCILLSLLLSFLLHKVQWHPILYNLVFSNFCHLYSVISVLTFYVARYILVYMFWALWHKDVFLRGCGLTSSREPAELRTSCFWLLISICYLVWFVKLLSEFDPIKSKAFLLVSYITEV